MSPASAAAISREIRELWRHDAPPIYERVLVGSFEDTLLATVLNMKTPAAIGAAPLGEGEPGCRKIENF